jgi:lactam utilization protein B
VTAVSGKIIPLKPESICIHGDSKNALASVVYLKQLLLKNKIEVKAF